ncbi:MAG: hypothetical protein LBK63_07920 [Treponema sp.]|jgi:hypothetical protein|nr:hypothetical protein [Treponema sp.]
MNISFLVLSAIGGIAIAWILNKLLADKIEDKKQRIGLKVSAYIVCIILGISFAAAYSLRMIMDVFIEDRIESIESKLAEMFPNSNILETNIDTSEFGSIVGELSQTMNDIDTSGDSYFERLIFDAFLNKLTGYAHTAENSIAAITAMGDENGLVAIKSVLYNLKNIAIETVSPYFLFVKIGILILLIIYIRIYTGIVVFLKRGGAMYNKSIVFGDINYADKSAKYKNKE